MLIKLLQILDLKGILFLICFITFLIDKIHKLYQKLSRQKEKEFFKYIFGLDYSNYQIPISKELFYYDSNSWKQFKNNIIKAKDEFESLGPKSVIKSKYINYTNLIYSRMEFLLNSNYISNRCKFPIAGYLILNPDDWEGYIKNNYTKTPGLLERNITSYKTHGLGFFNFFGIAFGLIGKLFQYANWFYPIYTIQMFLHFNKKEFEENLNFNILSCIITFSLALKFLGKIIEWIIDLLIFD